MDLALESENGTISQKMAHPGFPFSVILYPISGQGSWKWTVRVTAFELVNIGQVKFWCLDSDGFQKQLYLQYSLHLQIRVSIIT